MSEFESRFCLTDSSRASSASWLRTTKPPLLVDFGVDEEVVNMTSESGDRRSWLRRSRDLGGPFPWLNI